MASLPLSKTLDPADFDSLTEELAIVDQYFGTDRPQHDMRRWEYALALRAMGRSFNPPKRHIDVGGAGSPFVRMTEAYGWFPTIVDPEVNRSLAEYLELRPHLADAVTCLSVLEHVDDLDQFCYHLSCLVAPGGLLVLTFDYCKQPGFHKPVDTYHFHWMRRRIFNDFTGGQVHGRFGHRDFALLGGIEWKDYGPQVYDYTFRSLCLQKRA